MAVTSILLVIAFAIVSFATFSDSKTVQFDATSITSWTKPQTCLARYDREGTTASDKVTLYNGNIYWQMPHQRRAILIM